MPKGNTFKVKSDERLNTELKKEVQETRSSIFSSAEKVKMSKRFVTKPVDYEPSLEITDSFTNKKAVVPLFAYGEVREALNDLFPEEKELWVIYKRKDNTVALDFYLEGDPYDKDFIEKDFVSQEAAEKRAKEICEISELKMYSD